MPKGVVWSMCGPLSSVLLVFLKDLPLVTDTPPSEAERKYLVLFCVVGISSLIYQLLPNLKLL